MKQILPITNLHGVVDEEAMQWIDDSLIHVRSFKGLQKVCDKIFTSQKKNQLNY